MNRGVVLFVEGETEEEFYNKLKEILRKKCLNKMFSPANVELINLKGIGSFKDILNRKFSQGLLKDHPDIKYDVFLCYDTDTFEYDSSPYSIKIKWSMVEKKLREDGARKIFHIKQKHSIEDWIAKDTKNICKFLRLNSSTKIKSKNGLKIIEELFDKADKIYIKGKKAKGLIDSLDFNVIFKEICTDIKPLCSSLGVICNNSCIRKSK